MLSGKLSIKKAFCVKKKKNIKQNELEREHFEISCSFISHIYSCWCLLYTALIIIQSRDRVPFSHSHFIKFSYRIFFLLLIHKTTLNFAFYWHIWKLIYKLRFTFVLFPSSLIFCNCCCYCDIKKFICNWASEAICNQKWVWMMF